MEAPNLWMKLAKCFFMERGGKVESFVEQGFGSEEQERGNARLAACSGKKSTASLPLFMEAYREKGIMSKVKLG